MSQQHAVRANEMFHAEPSSDEHLIDGAVRNFQRLGEGRYVLALPGAGITFDIDRVRWDKDELRGVLDVRCDVAGARRIDSDGTISSGNVNLTSTRARQDLGRYLKGRARLECDWTGLVEEFASLVRRAEQTGDAPVLFRDMPEPTQEAVYTVDGLPLPARHMTILFGAGGAGKSLVALSCGVALARQGVRVLYADWEMEAADHWRRLRALVGSQLPDGLFYLRCARPLTIEADRISRIVAHERIGYLICDSIGYAADGPPEEANTALAYARAVRGFNVGSLHLSHVTKGEQGDKMPFGSAYWHNSARSTWFAKQSEDAAPGLTRIGLFQRKNNLGPLHTPIGFELVTSGSRLEVQAADVASMDDLASKLPVAQRVRGLLASTRQPLTLAALARELEVKLDTIEKAVKRDKGRVLAFMSGADGVRRVALVSDRTTPPDMRPKDLPL